MHLLLAALVVAAAVFALARRVDVRLVLSVAALALGVIAGSPATIVRTFLATLTRDQFVVPICCAVGFAYVLRHTGCDQHMVHALARPLRRARALLVPGAVLLGFAVNVPVVSQAGTAVALGAVLVPLLRDAGVTARTTGAAILLGVSIGGGLLNPGAPEWRTVAGALGVPSAVCIASALPLLLAQLLVATTVFWFVARRRDARDAAAGVPELDALVAASAEATSAEATSAEATSAEAASAEAAGASRAGEAEFRIAPLKAVVPAVPVALLFFAGPPLRWLHVPERWLVDTRNVADRVAFDSRLIGAAMLVGVLAATLVSGRRAAGGVARAFFDGAGYGFSAIISVIVVATCFGKGIELIGVDRLVGRAVRASPGAFFPVAGALPMAFASLSGSGMATTQTLFPFFVEPAQQLHLPLPRVGAVVAIASAAGRTLSPVAAITLLSAQLVRVPALALLARVAPAVLVATAVTVAAAALLPR